MSFLDWLRSLVAQFRPPLERRSLAQDLLDAANWTSNTLIVSGYNADFSLRSLEEIDRFLDETAPAVLAGRRGLLTDGFGRDLFALGAYVGEVFRARLEGQWAIDEDDPEAEMTAPVRLPRGRVVRPVLIVGNAFHGQLGKGLHAYAEAVAAGRVPVREEPYIGTELTAIEDPCLAEAVVASRIAAEAPEAAEAGARLLSSAGYETDFSLQSLEEIDRFIDEAASSGRAKPGGLLSEQTRRRLFEVGAYVGEVLRRKTGGHWVGDDTHAAPWMALELRLDTGERLWPVQRVAKRFHLGAEENVYVYGMDAAGALTRTEP